MSVTRSFVRPGIARRLAAALAAAWFFSALLFVPSARAGFFSFDLKDEKELGDKFDALIRAKMPIIEDTEIDDYLKQLITRLVHAKAPMPWPITITLINNNSLNAFAGPAGHVYVFTGLILQMKHESELAGVLAHELGHVSQGHIAKRVREGKVLSVGQLVGVLAGILLGQTTQQSDLGAALAMGSQAAAAQTYLKYSRDDEREADEVGLNAVIAAGYRPQGLVEAFQIMQRLKWLQGGGTIPTYLSTHPGLPERMGYLKDRISKLPPAILHRKDNDTAFLRAQTLVRARYSDPQNAVSYYRKLGDKLTCLDKLGLAIALSRASQNIRQAKPAFEAALACAPHDSLVLREAGRFFLKIREFARAQSLLETAVHQSPNDIDCLFEYGRLLAQKGDYRAAIPYLDQVVMRVPDNAELRAIYGQALGQAGDFFHAYLNLAYAALYSNNRQQMEYQMEKAKNAAKTDADRRDLVRLEMTLKNRMKLMGKSIF